MDLLVTKAKEAGFKTDEISIGLEAVLDAGFTQEELNELSVNTENDTIHVEELLAKIKRVKGQKLSSTGSV